MGSYLSQQSCVNCDDSKSGNPHSDCDSSLNFGSYILSGSLSAVQKDSTARISTLDHDLTSKSLSEGYSNTTSVIDNKNDSSTYISVRHINSYSKILLPDDCDDSKPRTPTPDYDSVSRSTDDEYFDGTGVIKDKHRISASFASRNMVSYFTRNLSADYGNSKPRTPSPDYDSSPKSLSKEYSNVTAAFNDKSDSSKCISVQNIISNFEKVLPSDHNVLKPRSPISDYHSSSKSSENGHSDCTVVIDNKDKISSSFVSRNMRCYFDRSLLAVCDDLKPRTPTPDYDSPPKSLAEGYWNSSFEINDQDDNLTCITPVNMGSSFARIQSANYDNSEPRTSTPNIDSSSRSTDDGYSCGTFVIDDHNKISSSFDSRSLRSYFHRSLSADYDDSKLRVPTPDYDSSSRSSDDRYSGCTVVIGDQDDTSACITSANMGSCSAIMLSINYDDSEPRTPTPDYDSSSRSSDDEYSCGTAVIDDQNGISANFSSRNTKYFFASRSSADYNDSKLRALTPDYDSPPKSLDEKYWSAAVAIDDHNGISSSIASHNICSYCARILSVNCDHSEPRMSIPHYNSSSVDQYSGSAATIDDQVGISASSASRNKGFYFPRSSFVNCNKLIATSPILDYDSSLSYSDDTLVPNDQDLTIGDETVGTWNSYFARRLSTGETFDASLILDKEDNPAVVTTQLISKDTYKLSDGHFTVDIEPDLIRKESIILALPTTSLSFTNPTYVRDEDDSEESLSDGTSGISSINRWIHGTSPEVIIRRPNSSETYYNCESSTKCSSIYYEIVDDYCLMRFGQCNSDQLRSWLFLFLFVTTMVVFMAWYFFIPTLMWTWMAIFMLLQIVGIANCLPAKIRKCCKNDNTPIYV